MALTALAVEKATCPEGKSQCKLYDAEGLYLLVKKNGSKLWRFRYKFAGKHQELALGAYPACMLLQARNLAKEARTKLTQGINPMAERKAIKEQAKYSERDFEAIALEWWEKQSSSWTSGYASKVKRWLEMDVFAEIGKLPINEIDEGHITDIMLGIEKSGHPTSASPTLTVISRIFGHALAHRLTRSNPAQGFPLKDILKPLPKTKHRAAITNPTELGKLMWDIDNLDRGTYCTIQSLRLIPRLFLRPKEIRTMKWAYVDFEAKLIRIPEEDMKKGRDHLVPLANQVVTQLKEVQVMTGYSTYVFPSVRNSHKPMSKNVMTNALRTMGYTADVITAHGFRATASTLLHEQGWEHELIETQLAHLTGTVTSRSYNRSKHLKGRVQLMQSWADYLDELRDASKASTTNKND